jgi:hypothetical protein
MDQRGNPGISKKKKKNPARGMAVSLSLSLVNVVCYQVEVSATGRSLVQRSPTESDLCECHREAWIMRMP